MKATYQFNVDVPHVAAFIIFQKKFEEFVFVFIIKQNFLSEKQVKLLIKISSHYLDKVKKLKKIYLIPA